jgi:hypothetical protein
VLDVLRGMVESIAAEPALSRLYAILQAEALDQAHPAHGHFAAREKRALEGFATLVSRHAADPASTARHLHALMDGLTLQWLRSEQGFDIVAVWDRVVADFVWAADTKQ